MVKHEDLTAEAPPTSIDPYAVLDVGRDADDGAIKSAYRKLALQRHPDKAAAGEREKAHVAFQELALAYAVLSDPGRRRRYDRTGSTEESIVDDAGFDWTEYYRAQFAEVVTEDRIAQIKAEYQGSAEERADILAEYTKYKGNLDKLFESVMLAEVLDDETRVRAVIDAAIASGDAEPFAKYTEETDKQKQRRRKRAEKEREEAEQALAEEDEDDEDEDKDSEDDVVHGKPSKAQTKAKVAAAKASTTKSKSHSNNKSKSKGAGSMNDLAALIQQRQAARSGEGFFDKLEAKYSGTGHGGGKGKKRASPDEPSEEAFAEMARRGKKARESPVATNGNGNGSGKKSKGKK